MREDDTSRQHATYSPSLKEIVSRANGIMLRAANAWSGVLVSFSLQILRWDVMLTASEIVDDQNKSKWMTANVALRMWYMQLMMHPTVTAHSLGGFWRYTPDASRNEWPKTSSAHWTSDAKMLEFWSIRNAFNYGASWPQRLSTHCNVWGRDAFRM